jgi:hypothetical protein
MTDTSKPWLQAPCKENQWMWRVYGLGMVWDHAQEWQARWKLHYMQMAYGSLNPNDEGQRPGLPQ